MILEREQEAADWLLAEQDAGRIHRCSSLNDLSPQALAEEYEERQRISRLRGCEGCGRLADSAELETMPAGIVLCSECAETMGDLYQKEQR